MLARAYDTFLKTKDRPTLIIVDSHIGYGSPHKQDSYEAHGEPLGVEEVKLVKRFYGWPEDAKFLVPDGVYENFKQGVGKRGAQLEAAWVKKFEQYTRQFPQESAELADIQARRLPHGWDKNLPTFPADAKGVASRESSGQVLNALAQNIPWLIGGSADLAKSNKVNLKVPGAGDFQPDNYAGRNFHFGVREHAMAAAATGMALSRLRVFNATFFNFTDYMRPSMRLAALMEVPVIYVMTHDSIGLGEDGPTHQPIEQLAGLRAMPNMLVLRPGDANEVTEAWRIALEQKHRPTTLVLSRQAIPTLDRTKYAPAAGVAKGAYVLADAEGGKPQVILMGTGSELSLCVDAYEKLKREGVKARVVSVPSWEIFEEQDRAYKESVLPSDITARVSVEMAATFGWERYTGPRGRNVGMHRFGASAPIKDLLKYFEFTVDRVVDEARSAIQGK
jgi:transketolase